MFEKRKIKHRPKAPPSNLHRRIEPYDIFSEIMVEVVFFQNDPVKMVMISVDIGDNCSIVLNVNVVLLY